MLNLFDVILGDEINTDSPNCQVDREELLRIKNLAGLIDHGDDADDDDGADEDLQDEEDDSDYDVDDDDGDDDEEDDSMSE